MSQRDKEILENLALPMEQVGQMLGVSRQAVLKGIGRFSDYLDGPRLLLFYSNLRNANPSKAEEFFSYAKGEFSNTTVNSLRSARIEIIEDPAMYGDFKEMWIVSSHPMELNVPTYFDTMLRDRFSNPEKRFEYYVPSKVSLELKSLLESSLQSDNSSASITIYDYGEGVPFPHCVITEPNDLHLYEGWVSLLRNPDSWGYLFGRLPKEQVNETILSIGRLKRLGDMGVVFTNNVNNGLDKRD